MNIIHDSRLNAWYIYLNDKIAKGAAVNQLHIGHQGEHDVILDYDKDDKLLGIEILENVKAPKRRTTYRMGKTS